VLRIVLALPLALAIVLALFLSMSTIIARGSSMRQDQNQNRIGEFIRVRTQTAPRNIREKPLPKPNKAPPPPMAPTIPTNVASVAIPNIKLDIPNLPATVAVGAQLPFVQGGGVELYDQELVPISQVAPQYPQRALMRNIEGWVRLRFIITETGSVRDIEIIETAPRPGVFETAAQQALLRWRFHPKLVRGAPIESQAEIVIDFTLKEGS
jgi:periplasmic protein TonB